MQLSNIRHGDIDEIVTSLIAAFNELLILFVADFRTLAKVTPPPRPDLSPVGSSHHASWLSTNSSTFRRRFSHTRTGAPAPLLSPPCPPPCPRTFAIVRCGAVPHSIHRRLPHTRTACHVWQHVAATALVAFSSSIDPLPPTPCTLFPSPVIPTPVPPFGPSIAPRTGGSYGLAARSLSPSLPLSLSLLLSSSLSLFLSLSLSFSLSLSLPLSLWQDVAHEIFKLVRPVRRQAFKSLC